MKTQNLIFLLAVLFLLVPMASHAQTHQFCPTDATCTWTGPQTFNGPVSIPGNVSVGGTLGAGSLTSTPFTGPIPWIDPMSLTYGAKCDGTTDDSVALQAAITAAIGNGSRLFIPPGKTCAHASTLNMNSGSSSVKIIGQAFSSTLKYTGTGSGWLWKNGNGTPFIFTPVVQGVSFVCSNASGCAKGIEAWSLSEGVFRDVFVGGTGSGFASTGFWCSACNIIDYDHLILNGQTAGNSATIGVDCINCAAIWAHHGDFFYFPTATMRFSGTGTAHITVEDNWFESQDVAILFDDSIGVITTDGFQVHNNRFLFNGMGGVVPSGAFLNQFIAKWNNTGTNSIQTYGFEFDDNTAVCASTLCSTAYPFVVSYSGTTGANTQTNINLRQNNLLAFATGAVNVTNGPSAAQTLVSLTNNYTVTGSRVALTTYVNGTATATTTFDPFGNKYIFGKPLTLQSGVLANDGTCTIPAWAFTNNPTSGMINNGGQPEICASGVGYFLFAADNFQVKASTSHCWAASVVNSANVLCISEQTTGELKVGSSPGASDGFLRTGMTVRLTTDLTLAANTSLQTIVSWSLPAAALNWSFTCDGTYSQATAAISDAFGIQVATNAPTRVDADGVAYLSASTFTAGNTANLTTTTATNILTFTPSATATTFNFHLHGSLQLANNANVINIMALQSNSADLLTIKAGTSCSLMP